MSNSRSEYVCDRCQLPLQPVAGGFRHAVNAVTKARACGPVPLPVARGSLLVPPGTPVTIWRPAGVITVGRRPFRQRYSPAAFEHQLGETTVLRKDGEPIATLVLNRMEVAPDGSGVTFFYEVLAEAAAA